MNKVNISDEEGRVPITDISIFDEMSEEEAEIVFGEPSDILKGGVGSGIKGHKTNYTDEMKIFKKSLEEVPTGKLKDIFKEVCPKALMMDWYRDLDGMAKFENIVSATFGLDTENQRKKVDAKASSRIFKMYLVSQEVAKRKHPSGNITLYRGVDGRTFDKFKEKKVGSVIEVQNHNLSSWTNKLGTAEDFANGRMTIEEEKQIDRGVILEYNMPIKRILVHPDLAIWDDAGSDGISEIIAISTGKNNIVFKDRMVRESLSWEENGIAKEFANKERNISKPLEADYKQIQEAAKKNDVEADSLDPGDRFHSINGSSYGITRVYQDSVNFDVRNFVILKKGKGFGKLIIADLIKEANGRTIGIDASDELRDFLTDIGMVAKPGVGSVRGSVEWQKKLMESLE